jgi:uncharacterized iron-regulated membrane protein
MSMSLRRDPRGTFTSALILGGLLSIVFLAAVAKVAVVTGVLYVFFPELGALSYEVFTRPAGAWARAPIMLVTLRTLRLHFPPALAVSLLPQIMPHADWSFVLAVAVGTSMLAGAFLLARPVLLSRNVVLEAG